MSDNSEWENAMIERRIAEMSDDDFRSLVSRTRPPEAPKGSMVPNVGNRPDHRPTDADQIALAEKEGRWDDAMRLKSVELQRQINQQSRGW